MQQQYTDVVAQIKDRMDIVDIVSKHVILKKKGANYWGCCPFHQEKTPSFSVNPQKGIYKCFGCGEGGDAIAFLMKINNQTFFEVIKEQAEIFGIELPTSFAPNDKKKEEKAQIIEILNKACEFFENNLAATNGKKALDYLSGRDIDENIIKTYRLGVSLNSADALHKELSKTYSDDLLEKAGLVLKKEQGGYVDRFKNRLMIPIISENGDVIAFGARALDKGQDPKYLNSPDTIVYNKSNVLYGLYQAKDAIKKQDATIIMEGYFDVISSQAHGVKNCVAACGTSLTQGHIKLISRYSQNRRIYLAFDTDNAGQHATARSAELLKDAFGGLGEIKQFSSSLTTGGVDKYSCEIRVVAPPQGKDPDEYIRENGAVAYLNYVEKAPLLLDYQLNKVLDEFKWQDLSPNEKLDAVNKIMPILSEIKNDIILNEYIKLVSGRINIEENALKKQLKTVSNTQMQVYKEQKTNVKKRINPVEKAQKNLLSMYLTSVDETNIRTLNEKISNVEFDDEKLRYIKNTIDKLVNTVNNELDLTKSLYVQFAEDNDFKDIITDLIYISDSFKNLSRADFNAVIDENIKVINQNSLMSEVNEIREKFKNADDNDIEAIKYQELLKEKLEKQYKEGLNR